MNSYLKQENDDLRDLTLEIQAYSKQIESQFTRLASDRTCVCQQIVVSSSPLSVKNKIPSAALEYDNKNTEQSDLLPEPAHLHANGGNGDVGIMF